MTDKAYCQSSKRHACTGAKTWGDTDSQSGSSVRYVFILGLMVRWLLLMSLGWRRRGRSHRARHIKRWNWCDWRTLSGHGLVTGEWVAAHRGAEVCE